MTAKNTFSLRKFFELEAASGILLLVAALIAFIWANSSGSENYFHLIQSHIGFGVGDFRLEKSIAHWINDALMVLFFFVVGLEIKRELLVGELSSRSKALLPIVCACGGAIVPALIYFALNPAGEARSGWGIPMATDIAFAVGILTLLGSRVPQAMKIFLLALAVVDDLIAIIVIGFFYTERLSWIWLFAAVAVFAMIALFKRFAIRHYTVYVILGICAWFAVLQSGVHATIAGVILGLLTPLELRGSNRSPLRELVQKLHPWVSFGIMPLFAFANAGVDIRAMDASAFSHPVFMGIFLGLLFGKPIGILFTAKLATLFAGASLPSKTTWRSLATVGFLGGIGFTMSLFVQELGMKSENLHSFAKAGILSASLVSAIVGLTWGFLVLTKSQSTNS